MSAPWNDWYHCMCGTYGTWLRGDPRGWRERWHREHVEGDYRKPPAKGTFEKVYEQSKREMKREEVRLSREVRHVALEAIVECLSSDGVEVIVAGLDDHHLHLLGRFRDRLPRRRLGWAKRHATKKLKEYVGTHGGAVGFRLAPGEGIWAKRSKAEPIRDRGHQVNTFRYILRHGKRGAAAWVSERVRRDGKIESLRRCRGWVRKNPRQRRGL